MNSSEGSPWPPAGVVIGWCVLAAGAAQVPFMILGARTTQLIPGAGVLLLLLTVPSGLLLIAGGIGLTFGKVYGYYCVYLATFFGGIGGLKIPYIPLIKRFVNIGPATEDLFLALNLLLVAVLVWEHWSRIKSLGPPKQRRQRLTVVALLVLGAASVSVGRAMIHRERGEKDIASALPVVGANFTNFPTVGKVPYVMVETKLPRGVSLVFSGNSGEVEIRALAEAHHLTKIDLPNAQKKFLPQVRAWKLNEFVFPGKFASSDDYYVGRLKGMPKVSLQLVYRKIDGRFTAQLFGTLPP